MTSLFSRLRGDLLLPLYMLCSPGDKGLCDDEGEVGRSLLELPGELFLLFRAIAVPDSSGDLLLVFFAPLRILPSDRRQYCGEPFRGRSLRHLQLPLSDSYV